MKIALVHNIANNFFSMARYFRDLGHEAHLFCQTGYTKWLPEHDLTEAAGYDWIHFVDLHQSEVHGFSFLRDFDIVICTGMRSARLPAALLQAGVAVHAYVPYGGDVTDCLADFEQHRENWLEHFSALKQIPFIVCGTYEPLLRVLSELNISHLQEYNPSIYVKQGHARLDLKSNTKKLKILSPTRHLWVSRVDAPEDFDLHRGLKRNDVLIRAFDKLCRWSPFSQSELYIVNYGPDFANTIKLIQSLKHCGPRVKVFRRKLQRWELFEQLQSADVMANAFRPNVHQLGTGVQEALASGCVVANHVGGTRPDVVGCPLLDATDEDELFYGLYTLEQSIDLRRALQFSAATWFESNLGLAAARRYVAVLEQCVGKRLDSVNLTQLFNSYGAGFNRPVQFFQGNSEQITMDGLAKSIKVLREGN